MVKVAVIGGSGYVAAEAIRLLLGHPQFDLKWIVSQSHPGEKLTDIFPHLSGPGDKFALATLDQFLAEADGQEVAVISALPHGASREVLARIDQCLGDHARIADLSADFRLRDQNTHEKFYGSPIPQDGLWEKFTFALPELTPGKPFNHIACPGCFATCLTLACAPLIGHTTGPLVATGVTGSTGSGASPKPGTHHPARNGAIWAYEPASHRHVPEAEVMLSDFGPAPEIWFVPHSGPLSRGMIVTVQTASTLNANEAEKLYQDFYQDKPFISVSKRMPSVREVASTNRCHIGVATDGRRIIATAVIDNLVKGAAGNGIQWLNRIYDFPETEGLWAPGDMWA